ncbi:unnamed protein product [Lactuca saligna]|uniref:Protein kinase domain-containing protein n=1 Tax=Lactuca saligna TaxID=75948 RepID=A0AA35ZEL0_LACSI|nr:unnamed protein product [Lactuca saligna]
MSDQNHFEHLRIHLADINNATANFSKACRIGGGGFGEVYKGELILHSRGQTVAFKRLDRKYGQGDREFRNEILLLSDYKHENIVSLLGFCDESKERILVYEYASRRGRDMYLNNKDLTWPQRLMISIGAACGLAFLHSDVGTQQKVFHRDVKSSNILLDDNWNAKISDFGLSKFAPTNNNISILYTNPVGTVGYCDPLYLETGFLTKESDIYSFGVVLFELVKNACEQHKLNDIVCAHLLHKIGPESLKEFTTIAYQCLMKKREERPSMNEIVEALKKALDYQLSPDKAYNPETILVQRKIYLPRIFNGVLALDSSIMDVGQINDLLKVLPTSEERDMLKGYTGDKEMLGEHGQIMESEKLASIMKEYDQILERTYRGHLNGLWFNNIRFPKEKDIFLLYKEGKEKGAYWFDFDKDLLNLDDASKIDFKELRKNKFAIVKEIEMAQQELNSSANDGGVSPRLYEALKTFLDDAERHPSVTYFFDDVNQDAESLVAYFQGNPKHQSLLEVLGLIVAFMELFKSQHVAFQEAEHERQVEADRIGMEEKFAVEPITLRVFMLLAVAILKTFDCSFKPL